MAKALLINPSYFRTYGSHVGGIANPVYPILSLAAIAGAVKQRGHSVRILDLSYRMYDPELIRQVIREEKPDIVGITATTPLANQMRDISFLVKDMSPDIFTVAGGAHPSALPYETMRESLLDMVASGEADWTVPDLLDGKSPKNIEGLYWRRGDEIQVNPTRGLVQNLDDLPIPAWEDYPPDCNKRMTKLIARHNPVTTIEFSRGCVFKCDFCGSKNTMGLGYRKKSPERCAEEMARVEQLGYREVVLVDDIFTSDNDWAARVCEEFIRKGVHVAWTCTNGIRVDSANTELFKLMRRAGCYRVYFGFESGNDRVLQAFGKGGKASLEKGVQAVEMARTAGLEPNGLFMVGLTGDTEESMQDTINYARRVKLDTMKCGITVPFPGTPSFNSLYRDERIKNLDWDQYTVYNNAEKLYDHSTLDWKIINKYFKKFYIEAYLKNPKYIWRRFIFVLKNGEIFWNAYYSIKFFLMVSTKPKGCQREAYAFEDRWRLLDLKPGDNLRTYKVPQARRAVSRKRSARKTAAVVIWNNTAGQVGSLNKA